jgi:hypothetical protein
MFLSLLLAEKKIVVHYFLTAPHNFCLFFKQGRAREDIHTCLSLLDDHWREGKLSEEATVKLGCLASGELFALSASARIIRIFIWYYVWRKKKHLEQQQMMLTN